MFALNFQSVKFIILISISIMKSCGCIKIFDRKSIE